jgi:hypothetical protein
MRYSFKIKSENLQQVKSLIKKYKSLRHLQNPYRTDRTYYFYMEGDVEEFNEFEQKIWEMESPEPIQTKSTLWSKLKSLFHHVSNN